MRWHLTCDWVICDSGSAGHPPQNVLLPLEIPAISFPWLHPEKDAEKALVGVHRVCVRQTESCPYPNEDLPRETVTR